MSSSEVDKRTLHLVSKEGELIDIPLHAVRLSGLVSLAVVEDQDEEEAQEIPLERVTTAILLKIVDFLVHYASEPLCHIPKPLNTTNISDVVQEWYGHFMQVEQETVYQMMLAASYMQIQPLVELTGATIGSWLRDKSPEQIRQTFNIVDDISPKVVAPRPSQPQQQQATSSATAASSLISSTVAQQQGSGAEGASSTVSS